MKKWWSRWLFAAIVFVLLLVGAGTQESLKAGEGKTIRVGFYEMEGFQQYDDLGNPVGYNVDYLSRVSTFTGWSYEYVKMNDFIEGMEMLENHQIDLLAPAQMTPERMEKYDYSDYSYGTEYTVLLTRAENEDYSYEDYDSFEGMRVGVVKDYLMSNHFMNYMQENDFETQLKYYDTPKDALAALEHGDVDGAIANLMMTGSKHKVLARFSPSPFYYITWKGNTALLEELNTAMRSLKNTYPDLENSLTEIYFPVYKQQYFSGEEEEYIKSLGTLKVTYAPGRIPISFRNEETGELDGISRDIFDRIQEISGLKFEYEELPYGPIEYDYFREHGFDLITGVEYNSANMNAPGLQVSNPYLSTKKVMVGKKNIEFDRNANFKVAISTGSQTIKDVLLAEYPNFEIIDYESIEECFDSVKKGTVDLLIQNQYVAENWLAKPKYDTMDVIPVEGLDDNLCFSVVVKKNGANEPGNPDSVKLITIINKAISQISQDEINTIIVQNTMKNKYTYTFWDFCYSYKYALTIALVSIILGLSIAIYIIELKKRTFMMQQEEENKILLQQKRYQLVMDESEEMIYEISLRGDASIASDRIKEKFGWGIPERVENPDVEKLLSIWHVHPEDQHQLRKSLINMIDENRSGESQVRMRREDVRYIWCKVSCLPLLDQDNTLVSIVGKIVDVDQEIKEKEELEWQSRTDGLTGLLNKNTFIEETIRYLSENSAVSTGIIFIDLDHFKEVNDTLGHIVGDQAIKEAAKKLQVIFSSFDLVARFGGDEFCIFVKDIPKNTLLDKLGWAVDKLKENYSDNNARVRVTASIGAVYCMKETADFQTLLDIADRAVYEAKKNGRNQFVVKEES